MLKARVSGFWCLFGEGVVGLFILKLLGNYYVGVHSSILSVSKLSTSARPTMNFLAVEGQIIRALPAICLTREV